MCIILRLLVKRNGLRSVICCCQYAVNDLSIVSQTVVYTKRPERREGIVELAVVNFNTELQGQCGQEKEMG